MMKESLISDCVPLTSQDYDKSLDIDWSFSAMSLHEDMAIPEEEGCNDNNRRYESAI